VRIRHGTSYHFVLTRVSIPARKGFDDLAKAIGRALDPDDLFAARIASVEHVVGIGLAIHRNDRRIDTEPRIPRGRLEADVGNQIAIWSVEAERVPAIRFLDPMLRLVGVDELPASICEAVGCAKRTFRVGTLRGVDGERNRLTGTNADRGQGVEPGPDRECSRPEVTQLGGVLRGRTARTFGVEISACSKLTRPRAHAILPKPK
jgi:hypothetical protein